MKQPVSFHPTASFASYLLGTLPHPLSGCARQAPDLTYPPPNRRSTQKTSAAPRLQRPPCRKEPPKDREAAPRHAVSGLLLLLLPPPPPLPPSPSYLRPAPLPGSNSPPRRRPNSRESRRRLPAEVGGARARHDRYVRRAALRGRRAASPSALGRFPKASLRVVQCC